MYEELQVVKATKNLSDKVKMGCIGTILYVYFEEKRGYEAELLQAEAGLSGHPWRKRHT